jgi:uncharacterized membrane protein HdeD (DUF308 family)
MEMLFKIGLYGLLGGIIALIFGILIIAKPKLLSYLVGIYLIIIGLLGIISSM